MIGNEDRWGIGWKVILLSRKLRGVAVVIGGCDYCLFTELGGTVGSVKMELLRANILLFSHIFSSYLFNYLQKIGDGVRKSTIHFCVKLRQNIKVI